MGKYIVLDVVFYAGSLNYDQGSGNYQELKKITKWDGKQYSLVSRYALRYSILESAKNVVNWQIDEGNVLTRETGKGGKEGAIQPSPEALLSGEILEYPEFDLFGYLITSTSPQNFRTAPVKISHAVSMTPFNYDALFNANIGLANRLRKKYGELSPNIFTAEEHETYYIYSVVIDLDKVGDMEVYLAKKSKIKNKEATMAKVKISDVDNGKHKFEFFYGDQKKTPFKIIGEENIFVFNPFNEKHEEVFQIDKILIPLKKDCVECSEDMQKKLEKIIENNEDVGAFILRYSLKNRKDAVKNRIEGLIKTILNLKRSIKGRDEDLSPKLLIAGIYEDVPYKTYKDKIALVDEFTEESYDEIEEKEEDRKKIVKVKHKEKKGSKPIFRIEKIEDGKELCKEKIDEKKVMDFVDEIFKNTYLFCWDDVLGNDSERLIKFLKDDLKIEWMENAEIKKSDDGKVITVAKDKNSLELELNEKENNVTLKISGGRTYEYILKEENSKINIYKKLSEVKVFHDSTIELEKIQNCQTNSK